MEQPTLPSGSHGENQHAELTPQGRQLAMTDSHGLGAAPLFSVALHNSGCISGTFQQLTQQRAGSRFCCQGRDTSPIDEAQSIKGFSLLSRAAAGRQPSGPPTSPLYLWMPPDRCSWVPGVYHVAGKEQIRNCYPQQQSGSVRTAAACDSWNTSAPSIAAPRTAFPGLFHSELPRCPKRSSHLFPTLGRSLPLFRSAISYEEAAAPAASGWTPSPAAVREPFEAHSLPADTVVRYHRPLPHDNNLTSTSKETTASDRDSSVALSSLNPPPVILPCSPAVLPLTPALLFEDGPARREEGRTLRQRSSNVLSSFSSESTPVSSSREGASSSVFSNHCANALFQDAERFSQFSSDKRDCVSFYSDKSRPGLSSQKGSFAGARTVVVPPLHKVGTLHEGLPVAQGKGESAQLLGFTFSTTAAGCTTRRNCLRQTPSLVSPEKVSYTPRLSPPTLSPVSADRLSPPGVCTPCTMSETRNAGCRSRRRPESARLSKVRSLPVPLNSENGSSASLSVRTPERGRASPLQCDRGGVAVSGTCPCVDCVSASPTSFVSGGPGTGSVNPSVATGSSTRSSLTAGAKAEGGNGDANASNSLQPRHVQGAAAAVACSSCAGPVCSKEKKGQDDKSGRDCNSEADCGGHTGNVEEEGLHEEKREPAKKELIDGLPSNGEITPGDTSCHQCAVLLHTLVHTADSMQKQLAEVELKMLRLQQQAMLDRSRGGLVSGIDPLPWLIATNPEQCHISSLREKSLRGGRETSLLPGGAEERGHRTDRDVDPVLREIEAERAKAIRERDELRTECQRLRLSVGSLMQAREVLERRVEELERCLKESSVNTLQCTGDQRDGVAEQGKICWGRGKLQMEEAGKPCGRIAGNGGREMSRTRDDGADGGRKVKHMQRKGESGREKEGGESSVRTDGGVEEGKRRTLRGDPEEGGEEDQQLFTDATKLTQLPDSLETKEEDKKSSSTGDAPTGKAPSSGHTVYTSSLQSRPTTEEETPLKTASARDNGGESTRSATGETLTALGLQEDETTSRLWKKQEEAGLLDCREDREPLGNSCLSRVRGGAVLEAAMGARGVTHLRREYSGHSADCEISVSSSISHSSCVPLPEVQESSKDTEACASRSGVDSVYPLLLLSRVVDTNDFLESEWERPFRLPLSAAQTGRLERGENSEEASRSDGPASLGRRRFAPTVTDAAQERSLCRPGNFRSTRIEHEGFHERLISPKKHDNIPHSHTQPSRALVPFLPVSKTEGRKDGKSSSASSTTATRRTCSEQASESLRVSRDEGESSPNREVLGFPGRNDWRTGDTRRSRTAKEGEQRIGTYWLSQKTEEQEGMWANEHGRGELHCFSSYSGCSAEQSIDEAPNSSFLSRPVSRRRAGRLKTSSTTRGDDLGVGGEEACTEKNSGGEEVDDQLQKEVASCRVTDTELDSSCSPGESPRPHRESRESRQRWRAPEGGERHRGRGQMPPHWGSLTEERERVHVEERRTWSCTITGASRGRKSTCVETRVPPSTGPRHEREHGARVRDASMKSVQISPSLSSFSSFSSPSSSPSSPLSVSLASPILEERTLSPML
ncbi:hypothetical protein CSUI_002210 [Cystoisospora suis]|uniref:Uncharacterized protein n=1 Tax=Cystoisospora suis TaxID=483139 RepID=A0A2C6L9Q9_9APIC|nr:hypothetical protein CSUI_002210 [Cystoisospora suis]